MAQPPPIKPKKTQAELRAEKILQEALSADKRILVLGRYAFPFHTWIDPKHTKVLLTAQENEREIDVTIRKKYIECIFFNNYESNGNIEAQALVLHKKYNFTHVVFQAEQDIIRAARLRGVMGLQGQTLSSALCFRDKVLMKQRINQNIAEETKAYFSTPICERVTSAVTILKFIQDHSLPVVVKPTRGMGSMDTYLIHTEEDLTKMLKNGVAEYGDGPIDYEVEKFCHGIMYHIDGFVHDGTVRNIWPSVYTNTCVSFQDSKFLGSHSLHKDNPLTSRLQECTVQILNAMDAPPSYSFHVEIFHTPEDKLVFCEAACRTGGAEVPTVFIELMECDLNKATVQVQCGDEPTNQFPSSWKEQRVPKGCAGWVLVYPKVGEILSIPTVCPYEGVLSYTPTNQRVYRSRAHCTDALGSFVIKGDTEAHVTELIEKAATWLIENTHWK